MDAQGWECRMGRMSRDVVEQSGREYHIYLRGEQVKVLNRLLDEHNALMKARGFRKLTGTEYLTSLATAYLNNRAADK